MNIKQALLKYIENKVVLNDKDYLITERYWNKACWLSSEVRELKMIMNNGNAKISTDATEYYNVVTIDNVPPASKKEQLLGGEITKQVSITWVHNVYGKQNVKLNLYANPQVQNSIVYDTQLYKESNTQGLLANDYGNYWT